MSRAFYNALDTMLFTHQGATPTGDEDNHMRALGANSAIVGVFDGCGGLGSRTYADLNGATGAYVASRTASGAVYDWFQSLQEGSFPGQEELLGSLRAYLDKGFSVISAYGVNSLRMRGSMVRDFPTTAAIALAHEDKQGVLVHIIWAGDSRVYLIDSEGLAQLTVDDLGGEDAMSNLSHDSALTNVLSSDGNYTLHHKCIRVSKPTIVFAATDGVFGYVQTPMEFEWMLLRVLSLSETPEVFMNRLKSVLGDVAGDDFTFSMMSFYFGAYSVLRRAFENRVKLLEERYVNPLQDQRTDELMQQLWQEYRQSYERYLQPEQEADNG